MPCPLRHRKGKPLFSTTLTFGRLHFHTSNLVLSGLRDSRPFHRTVVFTLPPLGSRVLTTRSSEKTTFAAAGLYLKRLHLSYPMEVSSEMSATHCCLVSGPFLVRPSGA